MAFLPDTVDVVVIGAGIVGASSAFQLASRGRRVAVLEAREAAAMGSSGRSNACVRGQWLDRTNIAMSWGSIQTYRDFGMRYGIDVGYRPFGYLLLIPEDRWESHLRGVELQQSMGVPVTVLEIGEALDRTSFDPAGVAGATWGSADGGVDPHLATNAFLTMAAQNAATVHFRAPVVAVEAGSGGWVVTTPAGVVRADAVVNAAGGWAGEVAALAGLDVPVHHSRRMIFSSAPGERRIPMTIDLETGFFLRSEGDRILMGYGGSHEQPGYNNSLDWAWLDAVMTAGRRRFPWIENLPMDRRASWAGTYEVTPDHMPFLGAMPGAPGWFNACGFSGHGVMQAPMTGMLVAEAVIDGGIHTIDDRALRIDRLYDGRPAPTPLVI